MKFFGLLTEKKRSISKESKSLNVVEEVKCEIWGEKDKEFEFFSYESLGVLANKSRF